MSRGGSVSKDLEQGLYTGDPAAAWLCQSLGWGQCDKAGRVWGVWDGEGDAPYSTGSELTLWKGTKPDNSGITGDPAGQDPSWPHHLLRTGPTPSPWHHFYGLAVSCRAKRCKAFAGLTRSVVTTKTENPGPRASPADFSLPVPLQCRSGE